MPCLPTRLGRAAASAVVAAAKVAIPGRYRAPMPPLARVARSHAPGVTGSCKLGAPDYGLIMRRGGEVFDAGHRVYGFGVWGVAHIQGARRSMCRPYQDVVRKTGRWAASRSNGTSALISSGQHLPNWIVPRFSHGLEELCKRQ